METERLIKAIDRLVELQEQILEELRYFNAGHPSCASNKDFFEDHLNVEDVIEILKISASTIYRMRKTGVLTTVKFGKRHYYSKSEINRIAYQLMK